MQFDPDLSQLKLIIVTWVDNAKLWFSHVDVSEQVTLSKELLEKGFEQTSRWLHALGVGFAFVTDVLKKFLPAFTKLLFICTVSFFGILFGFINRGIISQDRGAPWLALLLIVAITSSLMLVLQKYIADDNGVILSAMHVKLNNIDDEIKSIGEEIRKGFKILLLSDGPVIPAEDTTISAALALYTAPPIKFPIGEPYCQPIFLVTGSEL